MRLISVFLLVCCFIVKSQSVCTIEYCLSQNSLSSVEYFKIDEKLDLSPFFSYVKLWDGKLLDYIGYIGNNKKRLYVTFSDVAKCNDSTYTVSGETTVYNGATRKFNGEFTTKTHYKFDNNQLYDNSGYEYEVSEKETHGFTLLNFKLDENQELSSTGIFEGNILVFWYKDATGKLHYNNFLNHIPSYSNCIFNGFWTSYRTKKKSVVAWSHYRIPCSGDLDWGASEFSPNPKYYQYG